MALPSDGAGLAVVVRVATVESEHHVWPAPLPPPDAVLAPGVHRIPHKNTPGVPLMRRAL